MRPSRLDPLFAALTSLPGIGSKLEKLFARLLDREPPRTIDLLFHLPIGTIDRRARPKLRDVKPDMVVTVLVTVTHHRPPPPKRPRAPYQVYARDETGDITLTFFNARKDYLEKNLPLYRVRPVDADAGRRAILRQDVGLKFGGTKNEQARMDFRADLARIRCPVLILSGDRDPMSPPQFSETLAKCLPPQLVRHERFANCGHGVFSDDPERAFAVLREFILA